MTKFYLLRLLSKILTKKVLLLRKRERDPLNPDVNKGIEELNNKIKRIKELCDGINK